MVITIHLHSILRRSTPDGMQDRLQMEIEEGTTLKTVLQELDLPVADDALLLVVNGRIADQNQELSGGDEVRFMPAISGGRFTSPRQ
jgi:sulfur carrier protein ThiS